MLRKPPRCNTSSCCLSAAARTPRAAARFQAHHFLAEYDRPVAMHQHAFLQMCANCLRENGYLDILADARQFRDCIAMRHRCGCLRDDRARIELLSDVMRGGAD